MAEASGGGGTKSLAVNKRARFNFEIDERLECGVALRGSEVKSMKSGKFSFSDAYAKIENGELWLMGFHISTYERANLFNHDPDRVRKLLAHSAEIKRLKRKIDEKGYTLVPTRFYLKKGLVKIELGLGRGKKLFDKRNTIKDRDMSRDAEREIRQR